MNIKILTSAGIDYNAGLECFSGDASIYERVLRAYAADDVVQRARKAYESGDRRMLLAAVHEAKGASGNIALEDVYRVVSELVKLLRSENYTDEELTRRFLLFESAYSSSQTAIHRALEE